MRKRMAIYVNVIVDKKHGVQVHVDRDMGDENSSGTNE